MSRLKRSRKKIDISRFLKGGLVKPPGLGEVFDFFWEGGGLFWKCMKNSMVRTYDHFPNMPNFETESERISPGAIRRKEGWCSLGNIVFESPHLPPDSPELVQDRGGFKG